MLINEHTKYTGSQALREWARRIQTGEQEWVPGEPAVIGECCAGFGCVVRWSPWMTAEEVKAADPWNYQATTFLGDMYGHIMHIELKLRRLMDNHAYTFTGGEYSKFTDFNDADGRHINEVLEFLIECANLCREQGL